MSRSILVAGAMCVAIAVAGCNTSSQPTTTAATATAAPASSVALPTGAGCSESVTRFRNLMDQDLGMGHTTKAVHAQVSSEINAAAQLCASGNDAGARAAISASRAKHGYPAG